MKKSKGKTAEAFAEGAELSGRSLKRGINEEAESCGMAEVQVLDYS